MKAPTPVLILLSLWLARTMSATERSPVPGSTERVVASERMLDEVQAAWQRPDPTGPAPVIAVDPAGQDAWADKLDRIVLPAVNFSGMELGRVINTLNLLAQENDTPESRVRGVNLVYLDPAKANPVINLSLRNLTLRRVLDIVTRSAGYEYDLQTDVIVIRPRGQVDLETQFFPVSRPCVMRMTGRFANPQPQEKRGPDQPGQAMEGQQIREFLQLAGIDFGVAGSALAFDGSQLIVTQTPQNQRRIRNILSRYHDIRQVEIEAKFMEVQQGALEELGLQWGLAGRAGASDSASSQIGTSGVNRTLAEAFRNATSSQQISISGDSQPGGGLSLPAAAPSIPGGVLLGTTAGPLANFTGIVGEFDVKAILRALSQKSGTELLSAPRVTVLSGNPATITIAQELRYPQSYGQIQSQVGTGSISGGGSAGVSITSGTPEDFTTRNIGVELRVTPTVEEDNHSVSLELNPKVTEFEGFVEYGGPSVAISGGTTVTIPPGFYQPIFAVREVSTRVMLWNGATLIMGGLTREEVKKVNDKVPVLGSVPIIGRLFRSKGETTQKRNLLIFVTANLVNPGGAMQKAPIPVAGSRSSVVIPE